MLMKNKQVNSKSTSGSIQHSEPLNSSWIVQTAEGTVTSYYDPFCSNRVCTFKENKKTFIEFKSK